VTTVANVVRVSAAMFALGFGEHLWRRFLPKYLESLGAPVTAIGLFGTAEDFLDGVYQYPGGWIADRFGRRHALLLFVTLAALGYAIYAFAPSWPYVLVGLTLVSAWASMASPTLFAVIGDSLPVEHRTMGFTVQAVVRRIPMAIAPTLGGVMIARLGVRTGVRSGLAVAIVLAIVTLFIVSRVRIPVSAAHRPVGVRGVWQTFPLPLRWLLASDVFIRTCDAMVDVFLVLYAINVVGVTAPEFGILAAVQSVTSIVAYLPAARLADRTGRKPFVIATFVAFALFPVAVVLSHGFVGLLCAFVVGGLRETGEPARKALIVNLVGAEVRARSVGLYYLVRSVAIAPAAAIGGLLWRISPAFPFFVATTIGAVGVLVFVRTVDEQYAG